MASDMPASEEDRARLLERLDEELLKGGVMLSEWCSFIVQEADAAFLAGADLATILTATAAIETYLRAELNLKGSSRLGDMIDASGLDDSLKNSLHEIRKYRNKWVHVRDPWEDNEIQISPKKFSDELDRMATLAAIALRKTLYSNQWV